MSSGCSCSLIKKFMSVSVRSFFISYVTVGADGKMTVLQDLSSRSSNFRQFCEIVKFVWAFGTIVRDLKVSIIGYADYSFRTYVCNNVTLAIKAIIKLRCYIYMSKLKKSSNGHVKQTHVAQAGLC